MLRLKGWSLFCLGLVLVGIGILGVLGGDLLHQPVIPAMQSFGLTVLFVTLGLERYLRGAKLLVRLG